MTDVSDTRLEQLAAVALGQEGFCNWTLLCNELHAIATELLRYREKDLHCPTCDGDHL